MRRARGPAALAVVAVLGACSGGLYDFPTEGGTAATCRTLVGSVPDTVADQVTTPVDSERVAAWGDPRIVLRCGVTRPDALEPTSRCDEVDGIGWFAEDAGDGGHLFTTIGRTPAVSVEVPADVDPPATALLDLADVVRDHTEVTDPCQ